MSITKNELCDVLKDNGYLFVNGNIYENVGEQQPLGYIFACITDDISFTRTEQDILNDPNISYINELDAEILQSANIYKQKREEINKRTVKTLKSDERIINMNKDNYREHLERSDVLWNAPLYYGSVPEMDRLVDSDNWRDRLIAAKQGYASELLQYDDDDIIRARIAYNGQQYDLVSDSNSLVQNAIAFCAITDKKFLEHFPKGDVISRMNVESGVNSLFNSMKNVNDEYDFLQTRTTISIMTEDLEKYETAINIYKDLDELDKSDDKDLGEKRNALYEKLNELCLPVNNLNEAEHKYEEYLLRQNIYKGVVDKIYDVKEAQNISLQNVPDHIKQEITKKLNENLSFTQKASLSQSRKYKNEINVNRD